MRIIKHLWWGSLFIAALLIAGIAYRVYAQTPGTQYFPETNHTVGGEFLSYYRSLSEPFVILGYPISEATEDPITHNLVQYFQMGRLELRPDAPTGERVYLSNLGELVYTPGAPLADIPTDGPTCRLFRSTGKSVCYAFLQFYDAHKGETYFGSPISQVEVRDGRFVQYFEKARMEWRPEAPAGHRVGLTALGSYYYDLFKGGMEATPGPSIIQSNPRPASLQVRAFVTNSLLPANSQQTVYIIVQDQALNPVSEAVTGVTITLPDGRQENFRSPATDTNGISVLTFNVGQVDPKQIIKVEAVATAEGLEQRTSTWFRVWW